MNQPKPDAIGVMLSDTRTPARLYRLTDAPHRMGVAYFEPLDNVGARIGAPLRDFWPLLDHLP